MRRFDHPLTPPELYEKRPLNTTNISRDFSQKTTITCGVGRAATNGIVALPLEFRERNRARFRGRKMKRNQEEFLERAPPV
jgi:hypothetical protein